jgi:hypothetical protein
MVSDLQMDSHYLDVQQLASPRLSAPREHARVAGNLPLNRECLPHPRTSTRNSPYEPKFPDDYSSGIYFQPLYVTCLAIMYHQRQFTGTLGSRAILDFPIRTYKIGLV